MHYCMLLETLGNHKGMLNCALTHIHKTCTGGRRRGCGIRRKTPDTCIAAAKKYITAQLGISRVLREKNHNESNYYQEVSARALSPAI